MHPDWCSVKEEEPTELTGVVQSTSGSSATIELNDAGRLSVGAVVTLAVLNVPEVKKHDVVLYQKREHEVIRFTPGAGAELVCCDEGCSFFLNTHRFASDCKLVRPAPEAVFLAESKLWFTGPGCYDDDGDGVAIYFRYVESNDPRWYQTFKTQELASNALLHLAQCKRARRAR